MDARPNKNMATPSALIGASKVQPVDDGVGATKNLNFSADELAHSETMLAG